MGIVRKYQPDVLVNPRSGWYGDFKSEEDCTMRNMVLLLNVGPDRHGRITKAEQNVLRRHLALCCSTIKYEIQSWSIHRKRPLKQVDFIEGLSIGLSKTLR
jgi:hypothetical protein